MGEHIVITGMGAVTCAGVGVETYWDTLLQGRCCISEFPGDPEEFPVRRGGVIRDFNPADHLPKRLALDMEPFMQYAYLSAEEAMAQSDLTGANPERVGIVMASALSGLNLAGRAQTEFLQQGKKAGPKFLTKFMGNMTASRLAIEKGFKGPSLSLGTACASGGDAVLLGAMLLRARAADVVVVMAGEASLCGATIQSLSRTGALSKTGYSRPFDLRRDGFVAGEGGGALVLELESRAAERKAPVLARLLGWGNNTDGYNPVAPCPDGSGAARCMELALAQAGLKPEDIDYINAHGTATMKGDVAEANALHRVFGRRPVPVSSSKGAVGHLMGAGGITELIACVKALETGLIPPTVGCEEPDGACELNIVPAGPPLRAPLRRAMSNALGFGGQNSSVIVEKA
ncbi:MAG: beta-ketoacyl-[acyl-carrier-protein] synthase family protein [Oscillospiraceae bacterium]|nr:beta-ketoacyl-[acyl-carrier-protein] synthase family protein [Oscillospiraceae bacterium]